MSSYFFQKVWQIVSQIPKGKVATYGMIAGFLGEPRAAQVVGWALHQLPKDTKIPWQRVVNRQGMISTTCRAHHFLLQKRLLEREGVKVTKKSKGYWIDLKKYLWRA